MQIKPNPAAKRGKTKPRFCTKKAQSKTVYFAPFAVEILFKNYLPNTSTSMKWFASFEVLPFE